MFFRSTRRAGSQQERKEAWQGHRFKRILALTSIAPALPVELSTYSGHIIRRSLPDPENQGHQAGNK